MYRWVAPGGRQHQVRAGGAVRQHPATDNSIQQPRRKQTPRVCSQKGMAGPVRGRAEGSQAYDGPSAPPSGIGHRLGAKDRPQKGGYVQRPARPGTEVYRSPSAARPTGGARKRHRYSPRSRCSPPKWDGQSRMRVPPPHAATRTDVRRPDGLVAEQVVPRSSPLTKLTLSFIRRR